MLELRGVKIMILVVNRVMQVETRLNSFFEFFCARLFQILHSNVLFT